MRSKAYESKCANRIARRRKLQAALGTLATCGNPRCRRVAPPHGMSVVEVRMTVCSTSCAEAVRHALARKIKAAGL